jgi:hypothetical protein
MIGPVKALFLDIPSLLDSAWRRIEYRLSAECDYRPGPQPTPGEASPITLRPFWAKPPFLLFSITLFFRELRADVGPRHRAKSPNRRPAPGARRCGHHRSAHGCRFPISQRIGPDQAAV